MKKILLACGTGVITCALIRKMLQQQLDAGGAHIDANVGPVHGCLAFFMN